MNNIFPIWKLEGFFDTVFVKNWWSEYLFFFFSIKNLLQKSLIIKYKRYLTKINENFILTYSFN